jgi:hypothetical protein
VFIQEELRAGSVVIPPIATLEEFHCDEHRKNLPPIADGAPAVPAMFRDPEDIWPTQ